MLVKYFKYLQPKRRVAAAAVALVTSAGVGTWFLSYQAAAQSPRAIANSNDRISSTLPYGIDGSIYPKGLKTPIWHLKFHPSFSGSTLNTAVWSTCYAWANPAVGCRNFGSPEHEWYLPSQDRIRDGELQLLAQPLPTLGYNAKGQPQTYPCRSGMVTTFHSFNFEYGIVQIVAQLPTTTDMWPALWLAASNRHWPPEVDILESWIGMRRSTGVFLHPLDGRHPAGWPITADLTVGWHTFTLLWTPSELVWLIDQRLVLMTRSGVPHQPMYLLADLADRRSPSGGGCGGTLAIRSVSIWQSS